MRCKHCGKMIPDDSVYCLYCRAKTNAVINQVTTVDDGYQGVKCVNCGSHDLQVITEVRGTGVDGNKVYGYGTDAYFYIPLTPTGAATDISRLNECRNTIWSQLGEQLGVGAFDYFFEGVEVGTYNNITYHKAQYTK